MGSLMGNPIMDWLRGTDIQRDAASREPEVQAQREPVEQKLHLLPGVGAALRSGMLVHGPWATEMLEAAWGLGGDGNSAVFACLMALSFGHIEAPVRVWKLDAERKPQWQPESSLQLFLDDPNPQHDNLEVWFWTQWARHSDGNAYLRKIRAGDETAGNVVEMWPISPRVCRPVTERGSKNFIDYYRYDYAPGKWEKIPVENIIHFRIGIDDRDHRLGLSPLKRLVREICSDDEATSFADALLQNFGIPGLVVQSAPEASLTKEQALDVKNTVTNDFRGQNRGRVTVLSPGAKMEQFGFSPEQLNLEALHHVPETRVCAAMGVHPAVALLGVGLEQTANYASLRAVYEAFTERKLVPTWTMDAAKLNKQLKPDFSADRTVYVAHDLGDVRALQEDEDAKVKRLDIAVQGGWARPSFARSEMGWPDDPELDALWAERRRVAPAPPAQKSRTIELKAGEITFETLQALVELAAPGLAEDLAEYWDGQRRRVKRALVSGQ